MNGEAMRVTLRVTKALAAFERYRRIHVSR
jgi:hypothetical protein